MESDFNLLDKPWIVVMLDEKGSTKAISIKELFANAHQYKQLSGDTPTQDFAVLRFLIAILQTVFSRFNAEGYAYEWLDLDDETWQVIKLIDPGDRKDIMAYKKALLNTWKDIWDTEEFPDIIDKYLEKYRHRFNLIDEEYPFYQVTKQQLYDKNINKMGDIYAKTINRTISESNNKLAMFSHISDARKNILTKAEFIRWIISFQGYAGTSDKAKLPGIKESTGKGWEFGLGSIYLEGNNLFETLMLNLIQINSDSQDSILCKQTPIWERELDQVIVDKISQKAPDNLAQLYTDWSRLIVFDGNFNDTKISVVGLPAFDSSNYFLEPMTLWNYSSKKGEEHYYPRLHRAEKFFWRDFGALSRPSSSDKHRPGIISWLDTLKEKDYIADNDNIRIIAVGLVSQGAPSNTPIEELIDDVKVNIDVLIDKDQDGWGIRIAEEVDHTESTISKVLVGFAKDIQNIRNINTNGLADFVKAAVYFEIDQPFRTWLYEINLKDDKENQIECWRKILKKLIIKQADELVQAASNRDYLGDKDGFNIEMAYTKFLGKLNELLRKEETSCE